MKIIAAFKPLKIILGIRIESSEIKVQSSRFKDEK
jgi:hypothetical protein